MAAAMMSDLSIFLFLSWLSLLSALLIVVLWIHRQHFQSASVPSDAEMTANLAQKMQHDKLLTVGAKLSIVFSFVFLLSHFILNCAQPTDRLT